MRFHTHTVMPAISHRPLVRRLTRRPSPSVRERAANGWQLVRSKTSRCYVSPSRLDLDVLAKSDETLLSGWDLRLSGTIVRNAE